MFTIEVKDDQISAVLDRLARSLTDMTPAMQDIGEYLVEATKQRFVGGAAPDGVPWAPKSPATLEAYRRRGKRIDMRPLFGPSGRLHAEIFSDAGPGRVEVGSNLIYAAVMQFGAARGAFGKTSRGASIPWGNIPARPFLGVSDADRGEIITIVEEWLMQATEGGV